MTDKMDFEQPVIDDALVRRMVAAQFPQWADLPVRSAAVGGCAVEELAKVLGYDRIYCGTNSATQLLERRGWQFMEQGEASGENVSIYEKAL